jgi:hypothetical protein
MKTPHSILNFTQQSWMPAVKQLQRLRAAVSAACVTLGVPQAAECELSYEAQTLTIKTSAGLATRLRQIEPELKALLNAPFNAPPNAPSSAQSWLINTIDIRVVRHAQALSKHLQPIAWLNPNELRYGKRQAPTPEQRAVILSRLKIKRRALV